jgi:membrane protein
MIYGKPWKTFGKDLWHEISEDKLATGAAALSYFLVLALFPALIFLLSLLPYVPIANVQQAMLDFMRQGLPREAGDIIMDLVARLGARERQGLLSIGLLGAIWAASSGVTSVMEQLNVTYDVTDSRPWWKVRLRAIGLTFLLALLVVSAFSLIVVGGEAQDWLLANWGGGTGLQILFSLARWVVIVAMLLMAFAVTYYFGPDVVQKFRFVSPGSVFGTGLLIVASLGFRVYVANFGQYDATYGGLGAGVVLLLWLYIAGWVILLGSELNALIEHYSPEGKSKGQKAVVPQPALNPRQQAERELRDLQRDGTSPRDPVEEASWESFPASDPPSW